MVPAKRTREPNLENEWHLQSKCIKEIRARQRYDKKLRFIAAGACQTMLEPKQKMWAHLQGYQRGIPDIILVRLSDYEAMLNFHYVELKVGKNDLTDEQIEWRAFFVNGGQPFDTVYDIKAFTKILDAFCK